MTRPTPPSGGLPAWTAPEGSNLVRLRPPEPALPQFTWQQLEAQLIALRPDQARLAKQVVGMLRRRAVDTEPEMLLREVLCAAWTLLERPA